MYKLIIGIFIIFVSTYFLNKLTTIKENFESFEKCINQGYPEYFCIKTPFGNPFLNKECYLKNF